MKQYEAVVIGAGPGGYVTAIRLGQLGKKTAIVEREFMGGVCLNVGCIPSKALIHAASQYYNISNEGPEMGIEAKATINPKKLQEWKNGVVKKLTGGVEQLLKKNGVEIIKGTASFVDASTIDVGGEKVKSDNFVIATGSRIIEIPPLPFNGKNILNSTHALDLDVIPEKFVVVGGGFIGLEIGIVYAKLGSKVTIVEALDNVLATIDQDLVKVVVKNMKKMGIEILTKTKALGLQEKDPANAKTLHLDVESPEGKKTLEASHILVSVGRKPNSDKMGLDKAGVKLDDRGNIIADNQSRTNVKNIFAIGDVAGAPQLAHRASMDGLLAAATIAGHSSYKDYKTIPWAVFCDPEIAVCGMTEAEAKEKGIEVVIGKFPFAASGRALSMNASDGFVKVIVEKKTEIVLGVHIVGPEASNLIAEAALAIEMGACVEDIVRTIHTHPTLPEAIPEAFEFALGHAIHVVNPKART